jgi:aspartate/methionine/tyrosine aminotransferase
MSEFFPFAMERWQSTYENRVEYNLSESGVHPMSLRELLVLSGREDFEDVLLGYGQSNGSDLLRARIAALYANAGEENVVATNGSAEANFIAVWQLVQPGDEVAIIVPTYMQTYGLAQNFGVKVREIWLHEAAGWQPDPDEVNAAITDRTKLIIVTNPNNPTGAILSHSARSAIVSAAQRVGAWIIADEVYAGAEVNGPPTLSFFEEYERVIATGSLSKAYGLPGLRIGWAMAPQQLAAKLWARKDYMTISPGELTDQLATIALDPAVRPRVLDRTRRFLQTGLSVMEEWFAQSDIFTYTAPGAGAICYARYSLPVNSSELAERLRVQHSVLIVPGDHFAMDGYVRIGYGLEEAPLKRALAGFSDCLNSLAQLA